MLERFASSLSPQKKSPAPWTQNRKEEGVRNLISPYPSLTPTPPPPPLEYSPPPPPPRGGGGRKVKEEEEGQRVVRS